MKHYLQISAGYGPIEVREFVSKLARAVVARCEVVGLTIVSVDHRGQESAPSSVTLLVDHDPQVGLRDWLGTHQLIHQSRRRGRRGRKRWYAQLSAHHAEESTQEILASDVDFQSIRAGGPGGQHVNTTSSAIRAHHRPSGLSVRVSEERCQHANRRLALVRLAENLAQRDREREALDKTVRRQVHSQLVRGNPVMDWRVSGRGALERCSHSMGV
ncbi:MAG: putative peptide chain release factor H [Kiritimatiellia bacterium]|jgi:putative peptide chain release factor H